MIEIAQQTVKEMLKIILNKVADIETKINKEKELDSKNVKHRNKFANWVPFVLVLAVFFILLITFIYKKRNTVLVVEGNPYDIAVSDFKGEIATDTRSIVIDHGSITNYDYVTFIVDGEKYHAPPYTLKIEFDNYRDIEKYDYPYANYIMTVNHNMYYSTTTSSDNSLEADSITFKHADNTLEYFHNKILDSVGNSVKGKIEYVDFINPKAEGLLQIQNNEVIELSGGVTVLLDNNTISSKPCLNIEIVNDDMMGCSFVFNNLSNLEIQLDESGGMSLEGDVSGFKGEFETGEGKLVCTTASSQKEFYIGAQQVMGEGDSIAFKYDFNTDENDMIIKGNVKNAKLEDIDVLEGIIQFLYSNLTSIILTFIGALISFSIGKIERNK